MHPQYTPKQIKRFWSRVNIINDLNSCWNWKEGTFNHGYGRFRSGKDHLTHRVSWELAFGEIPENLCVCHKCDNPLCVRPDHLFLGTHQENMCDMANKNRAPRNTGEKSGTHKLNWQNIISIRDAYSNGRKIQTELAKDYGVSQSTIWQIVNYKTWIIEQNNG
jgi:hypothetical protein